MSLAIALLENYPALAIDICDVDWRDENIPTLHVWHPYFEIIADGAIDILRRFYELMELYGQVIKENDPESFASDYDDWYNHIQLEVEDWFIFYMQEINSQIWYDRLGNKSKFQDGE